MISWQMFFLYLNPPPLRYLPSGTTNIVDNQKFVLIWLTPDHPTLIPKYLSPVWLFLWHQPCFQSATFFEVDRYWRPINSRKYIMVSGKIYAISDSRGFLFCLISIFSLNSLLQCHKINLLCVTVNFITTIFIYVTTEQHIII